jgi:hypothetical protein
MSRLRVIEKIGATPGYVPNWVYFNLSPEGILTSRWEDYPAGKIHILVQPVTQEFLNNYKENA